MKNLVYQFQKLKESINQSYVFLVAWAFLISNSLTGQNSQDTIAKITINKPAIEVVINQSMIARFNAVVYDDKSAGLQYLVKNHNMDEISSILQTMSVDDISKATPEQLKKVAEMNKNTLKLQTISVKHDETLNPVVSVN